MGIQLRAIALTFLAAVTVSPINAASAATTSSDFVIQELSQDTGENTITVAHNLSIGSCSCADCTHFVLYDSTNHTTHNQQSFDQKYTLLLSAFVSARPVRVLYRDGDSTNYPGHDDCYHNMPLIFTLYAVGP